MRNVMKKFRKSTKEVYSHNGNSYVKQNGDYFKVATRASPFKKRRA